MTQTLATPTAQQTLNRWGNTALAFGVTGALLSWLPWVCVLGAMLAVVGVGSGLVGLFHTPRTSAAVGIAFSLVAIAVPILIYT